MVTAISTRNVPIHISNERWNLLCEGHPEIASLKNEVRNSIEDPEIIYRSSTDRLIAVKKLARGNYLVVIYQEHDRSNGMLITAYRAKDLLQFDEREILWKKNT